MLQCMCKICVQKTWKNICASPINGSNSLRVRLSLSWTHDAPPTINGKSLTRDEGRRVRGQEGDGLRDLPHHTRAAHGVGVLAVLKEGSIPNGQRGCWCIEPEAKNQVVLTPLLPFLPSCGSQ